MKRRQSVCSDTPRAAVSRVIPRYGPRGLFVLITLFILASGCTDPGQPPILSQLLPNPVIPVGSRQDLHMLGANLDKDVYFLIDTGRERILLGPPEVPGHWSFRCAFGFHFIYTFDSLEAFLESKGFPAELDIQAYNIGANLVNEAGAGDDLPSQSVTWVIENGS